VTDFLSEWWDRLVYAWWQLDHRAKALVAAIPAWGTRVAVVIASIGPSASASTPGPIPPTVPPPVPGATSSMRYEDGQTVLYARAPDGTWKELRTLEPNEVPGQFAKLAATSPDRRFVSYVKADDQRLTNATINLVDVETGEEQTLASIPQGL
jgi:hypothetical protein